METDWSLYELILFNLVQNSLKYNKCYDGDIVIVIKCKPLKKRLEEHHLDPELNAVLETIVIDTGVGIE
jgi:signal transduction histidine kinase